MLRRVAPAPRYRRSTLLLATLVAAACSDGTGPDGGGLPGRRLLDAREFSQ